jgi:sulfur relay (sulfurtransferase) DsrC/TusE family protein
MAKINVNTVAEESQGDTFDKFVSNFQENIKNLTARQKYEDIQSDRDYDLDIDGYIVGDLWNEKIAAEVMDLNGFQATIERIEALVEGREFYKGASLPTDYKDIASDLQFDANEFLKMFPKFPVIYFTRWGNMRKPNNLQELRDNPVRKT